MSEQEQKKIFAQNLTYYIAKSGKQQKEIAKELGFDYKTFSGWCNARSMPQMGKVQAIADYFGIVKTDLIDPQDRSKKPLNTLEAVSNGFQAIAFSTLPEEREMLKMYRYLPEELKKYIFNSIKSAYEQEKGNSEAVSAS